MLGALSAAGLTANPAKCQWGAHALTYLVGCHFTVVTDHRALTSLLTSTKLNSRLMQWALALQTYHFDIIHRSGSRHQNADGLSRQEWLNDTSQTPPLAREGEMLGVAQHYTADSSRGRGSLVDELIKYLYVLCVKYVNVVLCVSDWS